MRLVYVAQYFFRAKDRDDQVVKFWTAADYGYIKERLNELTVLCEPLAPVSCTIVVIMLFIM